MGTQKSEKAYPLAEAEVDRIEVWVHPAALGRLCLTVEEILRERMAQAWDEGMRTGTSRAMRKMSDEPDLPLAGASDNPYSPASNGAPDA